MRRSSLLAFAILTSLAGACSSSHAVDPGLFDGGADDAGSDASPDIGFPDSSDPAPEPPPEPGPTDECGDVRRTPLIYYGTAEPTAVPLSPGQVLASGHLNGSCSGAFIADEWVLTANHCGPRAGMQFCVGPIPANPNVCFRVTEVHNHPSQDMALFRVDAPASTRIPELEPIPIITESLEPYNGQIAEASGYGGQEDGRSGEREFSAEPIVGFFDEFVVIDGQGERGVCFGDSGGPLTTVVADGTVRHIGVLSYGDPSCVGRDNYSRADLAIEWIEARTGPTIVGDTGCGSIDDVGRCVSGRAYYCQGDELQNEACPGACGWDAGAGGFRCIEGADPCDGLDIRGTCEGEVARWCEGGEIRTRDCGGCGLVCSSDGAADCIEDPCMGIDFLGLCEGDTMVWCSRDGELRSRDCSRRGATCGYVNDEIGYSCVRGG